MTQTTTNPPYIFSSWAEHQQYEQAFTNEEDQKKYEEIHGRPIGPLEEEHDQDTSNHAGPSQIPKSKNTSAAREPWTKKITYS
jgi:hypothetical protein